MGFELPNLTDVEASTGGSYQLLPKDDYRLGINDVGDETATAGGDGAYAYIEYAVTDGDFEGATFRIFYNIKNKNPETVRIAHGDLKALALAVGVSPDGGSSDRLLGKTFMARVGIKPASVGKNGKQYGESNKIDKYYLPNETPAAATSAPAALRQPPIVAQPVRPAAVALTATGARPWAKRA